MAEFSYAQNFSVFYCCNCGVPYALTQDLRDRRKADGSNFYCPNGHPQCFKETAVTQLKKELEQEKKRREWAEASRERAYRSEIAYKGQITKLKNRVANGVCPCCKRTFQNLKRHINHMHPDFKKET